jgi:CSLREA domain-containing protein
MYLNTMNMTRSPHATGWHLVVLTIFIGLLALVSKGALAQDPVTFVVNRIEDAVDAVPGNGLCDADANDKVLQCTLRAAIMEANALPGVQTIQLPSGIYRLRLPGAMEDGSLTGDLDITSDLRILGQGTPQPVIDAAGLDRVMHLASEEGVQVHLDNLTLRGGDARGAPGGPGGGLVLDGHVSLSIANSAIIENMANNGGGIQLGRHSELSLAQVSVRNNLATDMGGGLSASGRTTIRLSIISGNQAGQPDVPGTKLGGGLFAGGEEPIVIEQSTIAENTALAAGGGIASADVGTNLSLLNSTVSSNRAPVAAGIEVDESVLLQHVTIAFNGGRGIQVNDPNAVVTMLNTIVAHNGDQNCFFATPGYLLVGSRNLSSDSSCAFVDPALNLSNTDPLLGPLQPNHGLTPSHEVLPGSLAIDGGNDEGCLAVDQRGVSRPQGVRCDIGAFEAQ